MVGERPIPRLIPAWAGKTLVERDGRVCWGAHPRVGGENGGYLVWLSWDQGSSPRGRGKLTGVPRDPTRFRLIPAWAGKTTSH